MTTDSDENLKQKYPQIIAFLSLEQVVLCARLEKTMKRPLTRKEIEDLFNKVPVLPEE